MAKGEDRFDRMGRIFARREAKVVADRIEKEIADWLKTHPDVPAWRLYSGLVAWAVHKSKESRSEEK